MADAGRFQQLAGEPSVHGKSIDETYALAAAAMAKARLVEATTLSPLDPSPAGTYTYPDMLEVDVYGRVKSTSSGSGGHDLYYAYTHGDGISPTIELTAAQGGIILRDKNPSLGAAAVLLGVEGPLGTSKWLQVLGSGETRLASPTLKETGGAWLAMGAVADGYLLKRSGTTITAVDPATIGVTAHGSLTGLTGTDHHTQYGLLAGRSGGQTLIGGTAATDYLKLVSTAGTGTTDYISLCVGTNGGTEGLRVIHDGKVGIGVAAPLELLSLQQAGTVTADTSILSLTNSGNAAAMTNTRTSILFNQWYYDAGTPAVADAAKITVGTETNWTSTASTQDAYMAFGVAVDGVVTERLHLTSAGFLSFDPADANDTGIYLSGANQMGIKCAGAAVFLVGTGYTYFGNDLTRSATGAQFKISNQMTDGASAIAIVLNNLTTLTTAGAKLVSIQNNGSERASFDKDGFLTIGSLLTTPATALLLDIAGPGATSTSRNSHSLKLTGRAQDQYDALYSANWTQFVNADPSWDPNHAGHSDYTWQSQINAGTAYNVMMLSDSGVLALPYLNSGAGTYPLKWTTTSGRLTYDTSDARQKFDVRDYAPGLAEVLRLQPRSFDYRAGRMQDGAPVLAETGTRRIGFVAQEVYGIIPEAVFKPDDEGLAFWGLDHERLLPAVVNAIHEEDDKVERLTKRVAELESEVRELRAAA